MIEYRVLREIEQNPAHTQRSLAAQLDVSLGKINYVLAGLVEKGIVKAKKLKNDPDKIRWQYILTPKGMKEKIEIAKSYLSARLREFDRIQQEIKDLEDVVGTQVSENSHVKTATTGHRAT
jgi:MarR family transcriptional regulator, temperature-dependent positive regulator of motility